MPMSSKNLQMNVVRLASPFSDAVSLSTSLLRSSSLSSHTVSQCEFESHSELPMCVYIAEAVRRHSARVQAAPPLPHPTELRRGEK